MLVGNLQFLFKVFSNFNLGFPFVIRISKLPPLPNFREIGLEKQRSRDFLLFFTRKELKIQDDIIKCFIRAFDVV